MKNWHKACDKTILKTKHSFCIIEALKDIITLFFESNRGERTRLIKLKLIKLGHELKYKVYASGLNDNDVREINNGFVNKEWMYDLHWYTEDVNNTYSPLSLPLVMECEWSNIRYLDKKKEPYSAMKFDFQKLIVSNAMLRLLIFRLNIRNRLTDLDELYKYFIAVINSYEHLEKNATFLFVAYDDKIKSFYYCEIKKI